jgi:general secretion pathway protein C
MRVSRALLTAAVPASLALVAFLNARAVSALVEATMNNGTEPALPPADAISPSRAALADIDTRPSSNSILDRNPFDHVTGPLRQVTDPVERAPLDADPANAPLCEGVRPVVLVGSEDQTAAFAALDYGDQRLLRKRGGDVGPATLEYVGRDRVWIRGRGGLCQALLFGVPPAKPETGATRTAAGPTTAAQQSQLEKDLSRQIAKTGPNEYVIERSAVDRILEAQAELMKHRMVPEKEGDRVVGIKVLGIKPGSLLSMLGIENGDRVETLNGFEMSDPEKMLEAYARLRTGADKLELRLTRGGKRMDVDYTIR